jgi:hypothetical protein
MNLAMTSREHRVVEELDERGHVSIRNHLFGDVVYPTFEVGRIDPHNPVWICCGKHQSYPDSGVDSERAAPTVVGG